jgi:predicted SprT family Zn-dependent metalloprotease
VQRSRTAPLPAAARRRVAHLLRRLAILWHRRAVAGTQVVVHSGLRRTLGRFSQRTRQIELSPAVLFGETLIDVLTHEAAHAALAECTTRPVRPHGPEWQQLMAAAGIADARATRWCQRANRDKASVTHRTSPQPGGGTQRTQVRPAGTQPRPKPATTFDHWCPVCQASRPAKKPVRAWRCAACVAAGLQGRLEITPRASRTPATREPREAQAARPRQTRKSQKPQALKPPRQNPQP